MIYNGDAPQAFWFNEQTRRRSGVVGYDPTSDLASDGPLAVERTGTNSIDWRGGEYQIANRRYQASHGTQTLESRDEEPRYDVVVASEGGTVNVLTGPPEDDEQWVIGTREDHDPSDETEWEIRKEAPEGMGATMPANSTQRQNVTVLAVVKVPSLDSTDGITVRDMRVPALRPARAPNQVTQTFNAEQLELSISNNRIHPVRVEPGYSLNVYKMAQFHVWEGDWDRDWDVSMSIRERDTVQTGQTSWQTNYETTQSVVMGEPLERFEVDEDDSATVFAFFQDNSGYEIEGDNDRFSFEIAYTIDPNDWFTE